MSGPRLFVTVVAATPPPRHSDDTVVHEADDVRAWMRARLEAARTIKRMPLKALNVVAPMSRALAS